MQPTVDVPTHDNHSEEITIRLTRLQQLFNSFDPSPFHAKDLDREADEYIFGSVDEFPLHKKLTLTIQLPETEFALTDVGTLQDAIHNYFSYRQQEVRRRMRSQRREGRTALGIGLVFLILCTSLRGAVLAFADSVIAGPLSESLLILGWVAMWRPIQIFLYDWRPLRHNLRVYNKLANMPVQVRQETG